MKTSKVLKMIIAVLIFTFAALFIIENMDPVPVYFPALKARRFGLVFVMFASYISGVLSATIFMAALGAKIRKKRKLSEPLEGEGELFDEE